MRKPKWVLNLGAICNALLISNNRKVTHYMDKKHEEANWITGIIIITLLPIILIIIASFFIKSWNH